MKKRVLCVFMTAVLCLAFTGIGFSQDKVLSDAELKKRLSAIFSDEQVQRIFAYRSTVSDKMAARSLLKAYRTCEKLKKNLSPVLTEWGSTQKEPAYDLDYFWLDQAVPGLLVGLYAEGTALLFDLDLKFFKSRSRGEEGPLTSYFNVIELSYGEDVSDWPMWQVRDWDYGGANALGSGTHLKILTAVDNALDESRLFEKELLKIRAEVLKSIIKGYDTFGYYDPERQLSHPAWVQKIHAELNQILTFVNLSEEERSQIKARTKQPFPEQAKEQG